MKPFSLVWLYPGQLDYALDAATWLTTTAELRTMGWEVTLVMAGTPGNRMINGIEVTCIPMNDIYLFRQIVFIANFYRLLLKRALKPDVILFEQMTAPWMLPMHISRLFSRRHRPLLVLDIRSLHMDKPNHQSLKSWLRGRFQELTGKYARFWVDGYTTITYRMADFMRLNQKQLWGVWPSGVDLDLFRPAQDLHSWPIDNQPVRLIYVGTLHYERNLMNLCRAVELANTEGNAFELWLVGSGNEGPALEEFASKTEGRICVFPPIAHAEIPLMLGQAHVGVLPFTDEIKFQVSSPIKLFEYMAAGLPLMATRLFCHKDVVGDDKYVFWADNADEQGLVKTLRQVWQQRSNLAQMGSRAAAAAPAWTWHESALKLKTALETGLKRNPE